MTVNYNPRDWYWIVAGSTTQVYSSKIGNYVPISDAAYVAWLAAGNTPSRIGTEAELGEALAPTGATRPIDAEILDAYKGAQTDRMQTEVIFRMFLWCVNEIRTLKGQATITAQQLRQFIKDQM